MRVGAANLVVLTAMEIKSTHLAQLQHISTERPQRGKSTCTSDSRLLCYMEYNIALLGVRYFANNAQGAAGDPRTRCAEQSQFVLATFKLCMHQLHAVGP